MEKTQEFDDEIEIDLRELLAVLLSQWLLILVVTVVTARFFLPHGKAFADR